MWKVLAKMSIKSTDSDSSSESSRKSGASLSTLQEDLDGNVSVDMFIFDEEETDVREESGDDWINSTYF